VEGNVTSQYDYSHDKSSSSNEMWLSNLKRGSLSNHSKTIKLDSDTIESIQNEWNQEGENTSHQGKTMLEDQINPSTQIDISRENTIITEWCDHGYSK
jgi:hypothetical protein